MQDLIYKRMLSIIFNYKGDKTMEQLLEILNDINPGIDYETETRLIDGGLLDSFSILSLIPELEDAFGIEITPIDMIPANFNSAKAIWDMIHRLNEE